MALSPLNQRRWRNFKANRRAHWSLMVFSILFGVSLFAEVLANDRPLLVEYRGEWRMPWPRSGQSSSPRWPQWRGQLQKRFLPR